MQLSIIAVDEHDRRARERDGTAVRIRDPEALQVVSKLFTAEEDIYCHRRVRESSGNVSKELLILGLEALRLIPITSDLRPEDFSGSCIGRARLRLEVIKRPLPQLTLPH